MEELASHQIDIEPNCPQEGWAELDPMEILFAIKACVKAVKKQLEGMHMSMSEIVTVGLTNQRETTIAWDSETGKPLYNAIGTQS